MSIFSKVGRCQDFARRGDFWSMAACREKRVLSSVRLDDPILGTPVAANGTLYATTMTRLFELKEE